MEVRASKGGFMTKQEEIRDGIARYVAERDPTDAPWEQLNQYQQLMALSTASDILNYLHSQGVEKLIGD